MPKEISNNSHKPTVVITGLKINDSLYTGATSIEYLKSLNTSYTNNTFTIKFIGLEFSNPQNIHYRFKLAGLENKWTTEQNRQEVRYANIPPGNYVFKVSAINSDNVASEEASLTINISPPFYNTWCSA
jgi:predicted phage tail protein